MTAEQLLDRLGQVRSLAFVARSSSPTGWNGRGTGTVVVETLPGGALTFTESGLWRPAGGREVRFRNVFRWAAVGGLLRLEHLRFGPGRPVHLFDLAPVEGGEWHSSSPHLCGRDCYAARMHVHDDRITLAWSVDGPRKQEAIEYDYAVETGPMSEGG